jgi:uncharacterized protein
LNPEGKDMTDKDKAIPSALNGAPKHRLGKHLNRLASEKSPYLLQHAENPVDWYAWGPEAFERARKEDKPVFLSIGYSTCHWCHVMAHESFEDPETALHMNETFISIKVDREERPDIDGLYMTVCQMMTGSGGWPLTVMMTPDKKPFFAGTYFPRETRGGRIGMRELIRTIGTLWATRRAELLSSAEQTTATLKQMAAGTEPGDPLSEALLDEAFTDLSARFDSRHGGFGQAPKFPTAQNFLFLLRYRQHDGKAEALEMVGKTLTAMRRGGIYDHIGFGFHRYSTDARWFLPHFEKMLYDQAMLSMAYVEAFQATGRRDFAATAQEIFAYVLRDMASPEGAFYASEDADSEGEEGTFYLWSEEEIRRILNRQEAELFIRVFNLSGAGNFAEEATGRKTGKNILAQSTALSVHAEKMNIPEAELEAGLKMIRQKLFEVRERRIHPFKDDKILADWNGLLIAALARGAQTLDQSEYAAAAGSAADFVLDRMRTPDGRLLHRHRDGQSSIKGLLDDYAFMIWGLLDLYEATFDVNYLKAALTLNDHQINHFWDSSGGGFFLSPDDGEALIVRQKEIYDGAIPSGNSAAMLNLLRLARMTGRTELEEKAVGIGRAFSQAIGRTPSAYMQLMTAVDFIRGPSYEVVIAGDPRAADTKAMLKALRTIYAPNKVVLLNPTREMPPEINRIAPYTQGMTALDGKATAYVCSNFSCRRPTTDITEMLRHLQKPLT